MRHRFSRHLALSLLLALTCAGARAQLIPGEVHTVTPNAPIPDDGYDGSLASMACAALDFTEVGSITDVTLDLTVDHTWVGDLVVKVVNPGGEVLTVLSRPGFAEGIDDGSGCCGWSADMVSAAPVSFFDGAFPSAEDLGAFGSTVCADDGVCDYHPAPDSGPGTHFAMFNGESGIGTWQVCVGDAVAEDPGTFVSATLSISGEGPICGDCELALTAEVNTTSLPASGGPLVFTVHATNYGASAEAVDLWIEADGPTSLRRRLGSGTLPPGSTVTRTVRLNVPAGAPNGTYDVDLELGDFRKPWCPCDVVSFTITKGDGLLARQGDAPLFEAAEAEEDFFAGAVSAGAEGAEVRPNPFAGQTTIRYDVAAPSPVRLAVYDLLGREVAVLVDGRQDAGTHRATFNASGLAAGTYVYRLAVGSDVQTGRLTLTW